jgi:hypothetical protein
VLEYIVIIGKFQNFPWFESVRISKILKISESNCVRINLIFIKLIVYKHSSELPSLINFLLKASTWLGSANAVYPTELDVIPSKSNNNHAPNCLILVITGLGISTM